MAELKNTLKTHAPVLLLMNRLSLVVQVLLKIPESIVAKEPLFLALWGNEKLHQNPRQALRLLESAWELAREKNENLAELLAGLGLINYQLLFHGNLWRLRRVVRRVMKLFGVMEEQKEISAMLAGACSYLIGFSVTYTMADYGLADKFVQKAEDNFRSYSEGSVPLGLTVARIYTKSVRGYLKESLLLQQKNYLFLNSPTVNPSTKLTCYVSYANFSMMQGRFLDYWSLKKELFEKHPVMAQNSAMGAFYYIWDMDLLLAKSDFGGVLELAQKALAKDLVKRTGHIGSQCQQYIALSYAFLGKKEAALKAVSQSMRMRARVGGAFFILLNHLVAASVWGIIGEFKKAEKVFKVVLRKLNAAQDRYFLPQAHAYRAHVRLLGGREREALSDIEGMIEIMASVENYHFFYWEGYMVRRLLEFYFEKTKNPADFALKLYKKRFGLDYLPSGEAVPRLRLSLARGRLYCLDAPAVYIDLAEIPGKETMLLDCLFRTPDRSVSKEKIINRIWPKGGKATKPKDNLYQTVHKLRARFAAITNKKLAKKYLRTSSEGHALCHVDVDLNHLLNQAEKGLQNLSESHFWLAEMHFREMKRLLDPFPLDYAWRVEESRLIGKAALAWVDLLFKVNEIENALEAAEMGLKADRANDGLHERRYKLYMEMAMPAKAALAKSDYERLFKEAG
jgi:DNA-binding winged helix-turn-helix (wHTH) protein